MSGFEIAGILLAALPILFQALDGHKNSISRIGQGFRKRKTIEKLARALRMQRQILIAIIKQIILESGCDTLPSDDAQISDFLNEQDTIDRVREYLGEENDATFDDAITECFESVQRVTARVASYIPSLKCQTDIQGLIDSSSATTEIEWRVRIALVISANDVNDEIKALDASIDTLDRFSSNLRRLRHLEEALPSQTAARLAKSLRIIRRYTEDLHDGLSQCWKHSCHVHHEAKLFLDARLTDTLKRTPLKDSTCQFRVVLYCKPKSQDPVWHETTVHAQDGENGTLASGTQVNTNNPQVSTDILQVNTSIPQINVNIPDASLNITQVNTNIPQVNTNIPQVNTNIPQVNTNIPQVNTNIPQVNTNIPQVNTNIPQVKIVTAPAQSSTTKPALIQDLCIALKNAESDKKHPVLHLMVPKKIGMSLDAAKPFTPPKAQQSITLRELLDDATGTHQNKYSLPLHARMVLALTLSSTLLQCLNTPWSAPALSASNIHFLLQGQTQKKQPDLLRPYLSVSFSPISTSPAPQPSLIKNSLQELGILLLEIWHTTLFETKYSINDSATSNSHRLAYALDWLDEVQNPLLDQYYTAVTHCIFRVLRAEPRIPAWDDHKLWRSVCEGIIKPLHKIVQQWSGGP